MSIKATTVETTWSETTAILTIHNPPVNTGNITLRRDLRDALLAVAAVEKLSAVVIGAKGRHFYAGSDISEFDRPLEEPQLPAVIAVLEAMPVPVVAAINGLALGGGLELALACDARIGDASAVIGFPEVALGMIPGAGGTVRTGRLLGPADAIDLVTSARQVGAAEALELGILDRVVEPDALRDAAIAFASGMVGRRRIRDLPVPQFGKAEVEETARRAAKRARPNVLEAIDVVRRGLTMDVDAALTEERAIFTRLREGDEAANLRYLFFAKRAAGTGLRTASRPKRIQRVGVAGAGTMGAAIVRLVESAGYDVTVFDLNPTALQRIAVETGTATTATVSGLAQSDLVIDAVFEDMQVKKQFFAELEPLVGDGTVLASNTSYLDLDEIARVLKRPERFAGFHFFNPADRNPLIEIVRTAAADDETISTLGNMATKLGKVAILAGVGDGFVANRVYADYRSQAEFLVEDGASPEQVDAAMVELGLPIGPFALGDMSGLDIAWARRKRLAPTRDPRQRYVTIADTLCEHGRFGKKTGQGWYQYPEGARRGTTDPHVTKIIRDARAVKGITPCDVTAEEVRARVLGSMVCAAANVLRDGVAQRPSDIDVALTEGFAFPRWLGGPLRHIATMPEGELLRALSAVYTSDPVTFGLAEPALEGRIPADIRVALDAVRATKD